MERQLTAGLSSLKELAEHTSHAAAQHAAAMQHDHELREQQSQLEADLSRRIAASLCKRKVADDSDADDADGAARNGASEGEPGGPLAVRVANPKRAREQEAVGDGAEAAQRTEPSAKKQRLDAPAEDRADGRDPKTTNQRGARDRKPL